MEGGEGMVAVVKGLGSSGLTVTLYDGIRHYTLMPNDALPQAQQDRPSLPLLPNTNLSTVAASPRQLSASSCRCDTDGRYATTYRTSHGFLTPTSPPEQLSEFPPQRSFIKSGGGNFEVGGTGSGETFHSANRVAGSLRRGTSSCPERCMGGSDSAARVSREPDVFADSLRKYPSLSPNKSFDMVDRLITDTQAKHSAKKQQCLNPSLRSNNNISTTAFCFDRNHSSNYYKNIYDKRNFQLNATGGKGNYSATRDLSPKRATNNPDRNRRRIRFQDNDDVLRNTRDASKRVNVGAQADINTVSKEVATFPRQVYNKRTIGIPLTPANSKYEQSVEVRESKRWFSISPERTTKCDHYKAVQTSVSLTNYSIPHKPLHITLSHTGLLTEIHSSKSVKQNKPDKEVVSLRKDLVKVLEWLNSSVCPMKNLHAQIVHKNTSKKISKKRPRMSRRLHRPLRVKLKTNIKRCLLYGPMWNLSLKEKKTADTKKATKEKGRKKMCTNVYRAEILQFNTKLKENFEDLIIDWIKSIPFEEWDYFGQLLNQKYISNSIVSSMKEILSHTMNTDQETLKLKIIGVLIRTPIKIQNNCSKKQFINQLAENFIQTLQKRNLACKRALPISTYKYLPKRDVLIPSPISSLFMPNKSQISTLISKEIKYFLENDILRVNADHFEEIEINLNDIMEKHIDSLCLGLYQSTKIEIEKCFRSRIARSDYQAQTYTNTLLDRIQKMFDITKEHTQHSKTYFRTESLIVMQNTSKASQSKKKNKVNIANQVNVDLDTKLENYRTKLAEQIDEWLTNLHLNVPQPGDKNFKKIVVNDLASDIVDRYKFFGMHPLSLGNEVDELEQLKFQIFKWINKLLGEDNMETLEHAQELMQRIKSIPAPVLEKRPNSIFSAPETVPGPSNSHQHNNLTDSSNIAHGTSNSINMSAPATPKENFVDKLNEEFEQFLRGWVEKIPIDVFSSEDQAKIREGIYNGIWKAIAKVRSNPEARGNKFYYQDILDSEIEDLFDLLPETPEFMSKKYKLKTDLIEKATEVHESLKLASVPYVKGLFQKVQKATAKMSRYVEDEDIEVFLEDRLIINLTNIFMRDTAYKEGNVVFLSIYQNRLIEKLRHFCNELKTVHGKPLNNISKEMYVADAMTVLMEVPPPNQDNVTSDELLFTFIGFEVEEWFTELPITPVVNEHEQFLRTRLQINLTKNIYDFIKQDVKGDSTRESIRTLAFKILEKLPLPRLPSSNLKILAENIVQRSITLPKYNEYIENLRTNTISYDDFKRKINLCSTYNNGRVPLSETSHSLDNQYYDRHELLEMNQPHIAVPNTPIDCSAGIPCSFIHRSIIGSKPTEFFTIPESHVPEVNQHHEPSAQDTSLSKAPTEVNNKNLMPNIDNRNYIKDSQEPNLATAASRQRATDRSKSENLDVVARHLQNSTDAQPRSVQGARSVRTSEAQVPLKLPSFGVRDKAEISYQKEYQVSGNWPQIPPSQDPRKPSKDGSGLETHNQVSHSQKEGIEEKDPMARLRQGVVKGQIVPFSLQREDKILETKKRTTARAGEDGGPTIDTQQENIRAEVSSNYQAGVPIVSQAIPQGSEQQESTKQKKGSSRLVTETGQIPAEGEQQLQNVINQYPGAASNQMAGPSWQSNVMRQTAEQNRRSTRDVGSTARAFTQPSGIPAASSTPMQAIPQVPLQMPPKLHRRRQMKEDRGRLDYDEVEDEESDEGDIRLRCKCMERILRRRRPTCYSWAQWYNCNSLRYPCPYFFYE